MTENTLNLLYERYVQLHPIDSALMQEGYQELEQLLKNMPLEEKNEIWKIVCDICAENERLAFMQGIKEGVKLYKELSE